MASKASALLEAERAARAEDAKVIAGLHRNLDETRATLAKLQAKSQRQRLPDTRKSVTRKFKICRPGHAAGDLKMYVTVGLYENGRPGELFIKADRTGSMASGALDAVAMSLSLAWQHGVPFESSVGKLVSLRFEPQGATGDPAYPIVSSPLDYAARWLLDRFGKKDG